MRNKVQQTITHIWDIKAHCLCFSEFFLLGQCILEVDVEAEVVNYFPLTLYFLWWSHVENTNQNVLAGPTLSVPEHRESWMVKKKRFYLRSALIEIPNRKLTPQCHWTEMEVIMKESFQKEKKNENRPLPLVSITWCQMVIRAVVVEGSTDKTTLCSTRGRQRELFRRLK